MTQPTANAGATTGADGGVAEGVMVALMVPQDVATTVAIPDGEAPEDLHITVAFLGTIPNISSPGPYLSNLLDAVGKVTAGRQPITGQISGVGRFDVGEEDVFYLSFDSPGLEELRRDLLEEFQSVGLEPVLNHGYTPHISLAYLPKSAPSPLQRIDPQPCTFTTLTVAWGPARLDLPFVTEGPPDIAVPYVEGFKAEVEERWFDALLEVYVNTVDEAKAEVLWQIVEGMGGLAELTQSDV